MAEITFSHAGKRYADGFEAVKDMNLEIHDGEFMILVGPSGCGKSTALRMVAGLEEISDGELVIGGERVNELAPRDRDIAMVLQNYALYPHMTVRENMGFALKHAKFPKAEIDRKVDEAAEILEREHPANLFVAGFIGSAMNFVPARLEDSQVKLPFGAIPIPPGINSKSRDVIAGIRPEHFEDAAIDGRGLRFTAEANIVESMGSELYAYLDLPGARERHTDQLDELAADSGIDEVPGRGTTVVARLDPASQARAGARIELALDSSQVKLFDIASGRSLSVH